MYRTGLRVSNSMNNQSTLEPVLSHQPGIKLRPTSLPHCSSFSSLRPWMMVLASSTLMLSLSQCSSRLRRVESVLFQQFYLSISCCLLLARIREVMVQSSFCCFWDAKGTAYGGDAGIPVMGGSGGIFFQESDYMYVEITSFLLRFTNQNSFYWGGAGAPLGEGEGIPQGLSTVAFLCDLSVGSSISSSDLSSLKNANELLKYFLSSSLDVFSCSVLLPTSVIFNKFLNWSTCLSIPNLPPIFVWVVLFLGLSYLLAVYLKVLSGLVWVTAWLGWVQPSVQETMVFLGEGMKLVLKRSREAVRVSVSMGFYLSVRLIVMWLSLSFFVKQCWWPKVDGGEVDIALFLDGLLLSAMAVYTLMLNCLAMESVSLFVGVVVGKQYSSCTSLSGQNPICLASGWWGWQASSTSEWQSRACDWWLLLCLFFARRFSRAICSGASPESELVCLTREGMVLGFSGRSVTSLMLLVVGEREMTKADREAASSWDNWELWVTCFREQFMEDWVLMVLGRAFVGLLNGCRFISWEVAACSMKEYCIVFLLSLQFGIVFGILILRQSEQDRMSALRQENCHRPFLFIAALTYQINYLSCPLSSNAATVSKILLTICSSLLSISPEMSLRSRCWLTHTFIFPEAVITHLSRLTVVALSFRKIDWWPSSIRRRISSSSLRVNWERAVSGQLTGQGLMVLRVVASPVKELTSLRLATSITLTMGACSTFRHSQIMVLQVSSLKMLLFMV